jgi:hypothetical protein
MTVGSIAAILALVSCVGTLLTLRLIRRGGAA